MQLHIKICVYLIRFFITTSNFALSGKKKTMQKIKKNRNLEIKLYNMSINLKVNLAKLPANSLPLQLQSSKQPERVTLFIKEKGHDSPTQNWNILDS